MIINMIYFRLFILKFGFLFSKLIYCFKYKRINLEASHANSASHSKCYRIKKYLIFMNEKQMLFFHAL